MAPSPIHFFGHHRASAKSTSPPLPSILAPHSPIILPLPSPPPSPPVDSNRTPMQRDFVGPRQAHPSPLSDQRPVFSVSPEDLRPDLPPPSPMSYSERTPVPADFLALHSPAPRSHHHHPLRSHPDTMGFTERPLNAAVLATGPHPLFPRDMNPKSPSSSPERTQTTRPRFPDRSSHPSGHVGGPTAAALDLFAMNENPALHENGGISSGAFDNEIDYDAPFDNPRRINRPFTIPPTSDLTFPPEEMREDPPSANESTFGVLQISNTTTCSPTSLLPPETYPVRTWFPITDVFLRTIISFNASGHVCIHQQLVLPGGYSPYESSSYPKAPLVFDRREHLSNTVVPRPELPLERILEAKPLPVPIPVGILSVKISIPLYLWKVEAVEVIGGWFIIVLEISNTMKPEGPKKDKKGKGKAPAKSKAEKQKLNGEYFAKPEGVKIKEYVEGHVNGRGARELPLWSWGLAMKLATDPPEASTGSCNSSGGDRHDDRADKQGKSRRAYSDSDSEEAFDDFIPGTNFLRPGCRKGKKDKKGKGIAREQKKRHLLSMRVRVEAVEELGGFGELIAHKTADLEKKVRAAKEALANTEKSLGVLMTALNKEDMPEDTSVTSEDSGTVTHLDSAVGLLRLTSVAEEGTAEDSEETTKAQEEHEKMLQKVGNLRSLEFEVVGKKRALRVVQWQRKERGAWLGIEDWEWQDE